MKLVPLWAGVLLLLAAQPSIAASSVDAKGISGAACQPANPAAGSSLAYSAYGVTNVGTVNRTVVCPLLGDAQTYATQGVDVYVDKANVTCAMSIVQLDLDTTLTTTLVNANTPFVSGHSAGYPYHIWFRPVAGRYSGEFYPVVMTCTLAPGARVTLIRFFEDGADTDGSGY